MRDVTFITFSQHFYTNHRWLVVIDFNLNIPLKLLFYHTNNNP